MRRKGVDFWAKVTRLVRTHFLAKKIALAGCRHHYPRKQSSTLRKKPGEYLSNTYSVLSLSLFFFCDLFIALECSFEGFATRLFYNAHTYRRASLCESAVQMGGVSGALQTGTRDLKHDEHISLYIDPMILKAPRTTSCSCVPAQDSRFCVSRVPTTCTVPLAVASRTCLSRSVMKRQEQELVLTQCSLSAFLQAIGRIFCSRAGIIFQAVSPCVRVSECVQTEVTGH